MSTPTIPAGNLFMNATLYTGTSATQVITNGVAGQAFQPDFVWIKSRNTTDGHDLIDSVRGASQNLYSNTTAAEDTVSRLTSFNSNGMTLAGGYGYTNASGQNFVAWQWKAGGAAVTNTSGTISSQVSANTTSGFSVVTYTGNGTGGATVGHGLSAVPSMVIVKCRSSAYIWPVKHASLASNNNVFLEQTTATLNVVSGTGSGGIGDLSSSTTFTCLSGTSNPNNTNQSGQTYVAYCWTPIAGYSAFGSYTGNGSADGPFIYTGFRPRFIILKVYSSGDTSDWRMYDTSRDTYNLAQNKLYANLSNAENSNGGETSATNDMDILSNGLKLRTNNTGTNNSGSTYIYAAFAENPFKYANAR